jgi:PAP2 superfamily
MTIKNIYPFAILAAAFILPASCEKTAPTLERAPYPETALEADADTWKTYIIPADVTIAVPEPELATSDAYKAELSALKSAMSSATEEQKEAAQYWGGNAIARWHEITREMAANYNAPPNYNSDGTYPVPDANNPTAYPRFPFANPPYASRVFALLAVAQYDALVATWKYKKQHQRLAPYKNDNSIQPTIPQNDLPSYPSEDAVIAAASREVLKFLFPGEKTVLDAYADEHKNSRLWAGANVQSDIDAGEIIGAFVAAQVIAYAKTDKMGAANKQSDYPLLQEDAKARGLNQLWTSREIPARPPLLPFFGNVKTWNMTFDEMVGIRPVAPPAPGTAEFQKDLDEMKDLAKNRTREHFRIASYWADGPGTYTPPGHWDRKATELIYESQLNEIRSARVMALVCTAMQDAGISCWNTKYYYLTQRPSEVSEDIKTCTGIPNFPGYTSGHSTFSGAAAQILQHLFPAHAAELDAMASEASSSRIYGCIHFRVDCEKGLEAGKKIGDFAIVRAKQDGAE